jgi:hypothetical protein
MSKTSGTPAAIAARTGRQNGNLDRPSCTAGAAIPPARSKRGAGASIARRAGQTTYQNQIKGKIARRAGASTVPEPCGGPAIPAAAGDQSGSNGIPPTSAVAAGAAIAGNH